MKTEKEKIRKTKKKKKKRGKVRHKQSAVLTFIFWIVLMISCFLFVFF